MILYVIDYGYSNTEGRAIGSTATNLFSVITTFKYKNLRVVNIKTHDKSKQFKHVIEYLSLIK